MALTVSCKRLPDEMPGGEDEHGRRTYTDVYEVDQTDGGALAAPVAVAIAAQSANAGPDIIPLRGQNYSYGGSTDLDSYALRFGWKRPFPKTNKYRVHVNVDYGPADGFNPAGSANPIRSSGKPSTGSSGPKSRSPSRKPRTSTTSRTSAARRSRSRRSRTRPARSPSTRRSSWSATRSSAPKRHTPR
jgi:hypothetical protein